MPDNPETGTRVKKPGIFLRNYQEQGLNLKTFASPEDQKSGQGTILGFLGMRSEVQE
jgi:hypothetical protein